MKHYALVVGIGDYDHPLIQPLSKPKIDAEAVKDILEKSGNYQDVVLLNSNVTRARLKTALEILLLKRGKNSNVLLYFTGHGFTAGEDEYDTQGYLSTQNCEIQIVNQKIQSVRNGFSFLSLNGMLAQAEPSSLVVFLDCCYSGFFIEEAQLNTKLSAFLRSNYFLVTACRSFEEASAFKSAEHSIFSSALLKALRKDKAQITAFDAFQHIERGLKNSGQEPLYLGSGTNIPIITQQQVSLPSEVKEDCPYRGLEPFTPETAEFFFGREDEIRLLHQKLNDLRFVMLIGASGSGKSSVVRAGLVPRLLLQNWQVMTMTPGDTPMQGLRRLLQRYLKLQSFSESRQKELLSVFDQEGLLAFTRATESKVPGSDPLLLVIDQFEEIFTQSAKEIQKQFIYELLSIWRVPSLLYVVGTMRADFFHHWLSTGQPTSVIQEDAVILGSLLGENLKAAIIEPARKQGYRLEEGLLRLLLKDIEEEKNSLPLLEFTLAELWHRRNTNNRQLTVKAYEQIDGLKGSLDKRATSIYDGLQSDEHRIWMKRICLQLVRIGRDQQDTRQRQPTSLLLDMGGQDEQAQRIILDVIDEMIRGRLLVSGGDFSSESESVIDDEKADERKSSSYIDVAHEALLDGWKKFREWRQENRDRRRLLQRLKDAYAEWQDKKEDENYLLTGGLLLEIDGEWDELIQILRGRQRLALTDFFLLSKERRQTNIIASNQAFANSRLKRASDKIREKLRSTPERAVEATLSAIELVGESQLAFQGQVIPAVQSALRCATTVTHERIRVDAHSDWISAIAFSPDGKLIASGSFDNTLRLWDLQGNPVSAPLVGHSDWITSVVFSPNGTCILSGSSDGTLQTWNLDGTPSGEIFKSTRNQINAIACSPLCDRIILGNSDGTLQLLDWKGNLIGKSFIGHTGQITSVKFSPDGRRVVSSSSDGSLRLWNLQGNSVTAPLTGHTGPVNEVDFDSKGERILSCGDDATLRLWNLDGSQIGEPLVSHCGSVNCARFSTDGKQVVIGGSDGTVRLWKLHNVFREYHVYRGHTSSVNSVAFSYSCDCIVSAGRNSYFKVWNTEHEAVSKPTIATGQSFRTLAINSKGLAALCTAGLSGAVTVYDIHKEKRIGSCHYGGYVNSITFSPEGDRFSIVHSDNSSSGRCSLSLHSIDLDAADNMGLKNIGGVGLSSKRKIVVAHNPKNGGVVVGDHDCRLQLVDAEAQLVRRPPQAVDTYFYTNGSQVSCVAFSTEGKKIASGSTDGTIRLWDLEGNLIVEPLIGHTHSVLSLAFSSIGSFLVSGDADSTLRLWNMLGNQIGEPFHMQSGSVTCVAFNPKSNLIISGSSDGALQLWDLKGNSIGEPLYGHDGEVVSIDFSSDGKLITSLGSDGTVGHWRGGEWQQWLKDCCLRLLNHTELTSARTETARRAIDVCRQVWTQQQLAEFLVAQGSVLACRGEVADAISKFDDARELGAGVMFKSSDRAQKLAEWSQK